MGRSYGVQQILSKKYKYITLSEEWQNAVGPRLGKPFTILIFGKPKNGKTTFVMKFCKELAMLGKVYYNSAEEGDSSTIQDAFKLCNMQEVPRGNFQLGDRDTFDEMVEKLKKNRALFVVIDSIDYMYLTKEQYQFLIETFPNKSFIIISWERAGDPKSQAAKDIRHMVGAVIHVKNYTAYCMGRYGPTEPYVIWHKKNNAPQSPPEQLSFLNHN